MVEPKNNGMNDDFSIVVLMEFMAAIGCFSSILPKACMTNPEKAKYTPAIRPLLSAAAHNSAIVKKEAIAHTPAARGQSNFQTRWSFERRS